MRRLKYRTGADIKLTNLEDIELDEHQKKVGKFRTPKMICDIWDDECIKLIIAVNNSRGNGDCRP